MPSRAGQGGRRADCKRFAPCGRYSLYYCRLYCSRWEVRHLCGFLSNRAEAIRRRKQAAEAAKNAKLIAMGLEEVEEEG